MNYDKFSALERLSFDRRFKIETIKENNIKAEENKRKMEEIEIIIGKAKGYLSSLNQVLEVVKKEDNNFKQRRLGYLEETIKDRLDFMYPDDVFEPKINFKVVRNKPKVKLKISKNNGKMTNPTNSEGGLLQQLINFSSSMSVVTILNKNKFYIDEAFGVSSPENLEKLGEILREHSDAGMQLLLISQGSALYQDLDRREIHLTSCNNKVSVKEIIDWGE